jgi:hypothetical protein
MLLQSISLPVNYLLGLSFCNPYCPTLSELNGGGGSSLPPVAPEVINILLLQRSNWLPDAPSEHIVARVFSVGGKFKYSI